MGVFNHCRGTLLGWELDDTQSKGLQHETDDDPWDPDEKPEDGPAEYIGHGFTDDEMDDISTRSDEGPKEAPVVGSDLQEVMKPSWKGLPQGWQFENGMVIHTAYGSTHFKNADGIFGAC